MDEAVGGAGSGLAGIDYTIVIIYMAGVFVLGTFFSRYVKSAGDFFAAASFPGSGFSRGGLGGGRFLGSGDFNADGLPDLAVPNISAVQVLLNQ